MLIFLKKWKDKHFKKRSKIKESTTSTQTTKHSVCKTKMKQNRDSLITKYILWKDKINSRLDINEEGAKELEDKS